MKAMVLQRTQPIQGDPLIMIELDDPRPKPGEVRIKVAACGICHTDLHVIEGELPAKKLPLIPGHQIVGSVDAVGAGVTRFSPGDRAGIAWLHSTCGKCKFCLRGMENLCESALFTGYDVDGGYAQYTVVPQSYAYPVPAQFPDVEAAPLLCAGIIGFRALRLSGADKNGPLGLFGFGASAHIVIQIARHQGSDVFVFTRSEHHRQLATKLGAAWAGTAGEQPPAKLQSAIIFAPAGGLVLDALAVLEKGGTLALAGIYMTQVPPMDYREHLYWEKRIVSVANSTRKDAEDLLSVSAEIPVRTEVQEFQLHEANRALNLLKRGNIQGAGVLRLPA
ncbi:MAG: zinc-dependent alcohol dehydrogenase family protein [Dehalococcoidia bacterium]|nr:zinc-dependent alcohol dehydrogenase family protein [Dehalococcoidia bacterium]